MHPTAATHDPIGLQLPRSPQPTEAGEGLQRGGSGCPMCLGDVLYGHCVERCEEGGVWRIDEDRLVRGDLVLRWGLETKRGTIPMWNLVSPDGGHRLTGDIGETCRSLGIPVPAAEMLRRVQR